MFYLWPLPNCDVTDHFKISVRYSQKCAVDSWSVVSEQHHRQDLISTEGGGSLFPVSESQTVKTSRCRLHRKQIWWRLTSSVTTSEQSTTPTTCRTALLEKTREENTSCTPSLWAETTSTTRCCLLFLRRFMTPELHWPEESVLSLKIKGRFC